MPPFKPIAAFFGKLILLYALLIVPWPGLRDAYGALFQFGGNLAFRTFGADGRVYFAPAEPPPTDKDAKDTWMTLESIQSRNRATLAIHTRLMGYLPTAFAAALILATPVSWGRRVAALLFGLILMSAFAGVEVFLRLLDAFSEKDPLNIFAFGPWAKGTVRVLLFVLAKSPVTAYIAPVFVWIVVTFRRSDWGTWLTTPTPGASHQTRRSPA